MSDLSFPRERPASVPPAVGPGVVLGGKYRLEATIAHGGGAKVWRAVHITLNQPVAVKFLDGSFATRTETFLREAKVAASVRNNHVVDIIDFGILETTSHEPEPYMVMALLEGETLGARLTRGAISDELVASIGLQVLTGLDAVHRAAIVHRDVKPANIFLTEDDEGVFVRLLDFGVSQQADATNDAKIIIGTPEYMSPEQARGAPLDLRSDLYSLGVVLYEMFCGGVPFEHDDPRKLVALAASAKVMPLRELRPDIPEIAGIVERAMQRDPNARWSSAREMRHALLDALSHGREVSGRFPTATHDSIRPLPPPVAANLREAGEPASNELATTTDLPIARRHVARIVVALSLVVLGALGLVWGAGVGEERASASPGTRQPAPEPSVLFPVVLPAPPPPLVTPAAPPPTPQPSTPSIDVGDPEPPARASVRRRHRAAPVEAVPVLHRELDF